MSIQLTCTGVSANCVLPPKLPQCMHGCDVRSSPSVDYSYLYISLYYMCTCAYGWPRQYKSNLSSISMNLILYCGWGSVKLVRRCSSIEDTIFVRQDWLTIGHFTESSAIATHTVYRVPLGTMYIQTDAQKRNVKMVCQKVYKQGRDDIIKVKVNIQSPMKLWTLTSTFMSCIYIDILLKHTNSTLNVL